MAIKDKRNRYHRLSVLASAKERTAGIALAQANEELVQAKSRLQELHDYATSNDEKMISAERQISVNLHNRRLFLGKLQEAIRTQTSILSQLGRHCAALLDQWQACHQEKRLYEKLEEQASLRVQSLQRQADTKQSDEVSAQQYFQKTRDS